MFSGKCKETTYGGRGVGHLQHGRRACPHSGCTVITRGLCTPGQREKERKQAR